jgi:hypothetical protein
MSGTLILNTNQTYPHRQTALREELHDVVTLMHPVHTPLFSLLSHRRMGNYISEHLVDDIGWDGTVTQMEGDIAHAGADAKFDAPLYPTRIKMMAQINTISYDVDNSSQAMLIAGTRSPLEEQQYKKLNRLMKNAEMAAHFGLVNPEDVPVKGGDPDQTGTSTSTPPSKDPRKTDGLVTATARDGVYRNYPVVPTSGVTDPLGVTIGQQYFTNFFDAGNTPLDLDMFAQNIIEPASDSRYGFNADGALVLCSARVKRLFNQFADQVPAFERNIEATRYAILDNVDVVETVYGTHFINRDRYFELPAQQTFTLTGYGIPATGSTPSGNYTFSSNDSFLMVDPRLAYIGIVRGFSRQRLGPVGDSVKEQIVGEWAIQRDHPLAAVGATGVVAP